MITLWLPSSIRELTAPMSVTRITVQASTGAVTNFFLVDGRLCHTLQTTRTLQWILLSNGRKGQQSLQSLQWTCNSTRQDPGSFSHLTPWQGWATALLLWSCLDRYTSPQWRSHDQDRVLSAVTEDTFRVSASALPGRTIQRLLGAAPSVPQSPIKKQWHRPGRSGTFATAGKKERTP